VRNKIEKMKSICIAILNYADKHKGALDEKSKADVKAMLARLDNLESEQHTTREGKTAARLEVKKATVALKNVILRSRRLLEAFAVGNANGPGLPKATANSFFPSRIQAFAVAHKEDLEGLPTEPLVTKTLTALNAATAQFAQAYGTARTEKRDLTALNVSLDEELTAIAGKLYGYRLIAAYSMPRADRRDLLSLIRSNIPAETQSKKAEATATTTVKSIPDAKPVALPPVPMTVPQTGEHLVMSANA